MKSLLCTCFMLFLNNMLSSAACSAGACDVNEVNVSSVCNKVFTLLPCVCYTVHDLFCIILHSFCLKLRSALPSFPLL